MPLKFSVVLESDICRIGKEISESNCPKAETPDRVSDVLMQLSKIQASEPIEVASQVKAVFAQQGWTVQGNVYQASGDIFVTVKQPDEEKPSQSLNA